MGRVRLNIEAVIFDMDGVITNTMPDHYRAWKEVFARRGHHVTHLDIYRREGQKGVDSVREISREHGWPFHEKEALRILKEKERLFKTIIRPRFIPGSRSFLHGLQRKGFRLALVTGTARHELKRILPDRLRQCFTVVVTGTDVQNGKPHPEPYRKALRTLKVNPKHAVAIENASFGILSAKRAGLRCLALETSLPRRHLRDADAVFSSFRELRQKVTFDFVQK